MRSPAQPVQAELPERLEILLSWLSTIYISKHISKSIYIKMGLYCMFRAAAHGELPCSDTDTENEHVAISLRELCPPIAHPTLPPERMYYESMYYII